MPRQLPHVVGIPAVGCLCALSHAQTVPAGFAIEQLATGLASPTCAALTPDGRIFIALKGGALRVWTPDRGLLVTPFHTFSVNAAGERGFVGLTLDPGFATNGVLYAHISRAGPKPGPDLIRLTASTTNPDVADPASVTVLLSLSPYSTATNHVGGGVHFGPDGKLYLALGENANRAQAQDLNTVYGKLLRFNPDGSIPDDNPFYKETTGDSRAIWALGLRNPFTFAFQPRTGRLFINDVGSASWEEINDATRGDNFGWPDTEGNFDPAQFPEYTPPIYAYGRETGQVITGGVFYNPAAPSFPAAFTGDYFFADLSARWVKRLDPTSGAVEDFASGMGMVDLDVDPEGRLLMLSFSGNLLRVSTTLCRADFNADTLLDSADFFDFLTAFFKLQSSADFNADTIINSQDFFDYVTAFFGGC